MSAFLATAVGATAAYALVRFRYEPTLGMIGFVIGTPLCTSSSSPHWACHGPSSSPSAVAIFLILASTVSRRFKRALGNADIAFWLISQRILPPVAVVLPIYVFYQNLGLLDTHIGLIVTYVATNLPIVIWLMRDYFYQCAPSNSRRARPWTVRAPYRIFRSIVLPVSTPGLVATFMLVLVFAWNEYLLALFLSTANAQTMPLLVAAQNATRGPQWWYMSVLIIIMIIPVIVMAIVLERYISRGLLRGAIKG